MATRTIHGSAHDTGLPDRSVHCVLTSPPYYSLRAYAGGDEQLIDWPEIAYAPMSGLDKIVVPSMRCALGAEPDAAHYIGHLVHCAREWRRVLRPDGTCWVNLADSFTGSGGAGGDYNEGGLRAGQPKFKGGKSAGLKRKNLMMIPARFALAAQADGWNLRFDVIWSKPNSSPESASDRPTRAHEYIYLLTKSEHYFYDAEAIAEPSKSYATLPRDEDGNVRGKAGPNAFRGQGQNREAGGGRANREGRDPREIGRGSTRNKRSVWEIATRPYAGAHFATWPEQLAETIIRAGTSAHGCCAACGSPYERAVERGESSWERRKQDGDPSRYEMLGSAAPLGRTLSDPVDRRSGGYGQPAEKRMTGWRRTCRCECGEISPAVVMDPFCGSGTTLRVAERLGRDSVGVDVSSEYLTTLVPRRVGGVQKLLIAD